MPHPLHICWPFRCCHLLQCSLRFGCIIYHCICFAIIVFYWSEMYCLIFPLSSTMPSVLHMLHWCIITLQCFILLIRIHIVTIHTLISVDITASQANPTMPSVLHILRWFIIGLRCFFLLTNIRFVSILALIPLDITGSQVNPLEFSRSLLLPPGGGEGIVLVTFDTLTILIPASPWHPKMQFVICTIVVYRDVWVSACDVRLLKRHFGGQIVKMNRIVNTRCFHADDHSRHLVLRLLNLTQDCSKNVFIHSLLVALWYCVPGIHRGCIRVCNARRG